MGLLEIFYVGSSRDRSSTFSELVLNLVWLLRYVLGNIGLMSPVPKSASPIWLPVSYDVRDKMVHARTLNWARLIGLTRTYTRSKLSTRALISFERFHTRVWIPSWFPVCMGGSPWRHKKKTLVGNRLTSQTNRELTELNRIFRNSNVRFYANCVYHKPLRKETREIVRSVLNILYGCRFSPKFFNFFNFVINLNGKISM